MSASNIEQKTRWQKTPVASLVRNAVSGIYYARDRVSGKLIWKTLKSDRMSVAKLRLMDFPKEQNSRAESIQAIVQGKMIFADTVATYQQQLENAQHLKPNAMLYRKKHQRSPQKLAKLERHRRAENFSRGLPGLGIRFCYFREVPVDLSAPVGFVLRVHPLAIHIAQDWLRGGPQPAFGGALVNDNYSFPPVE